MRLGELFRAYALEHIFDRIFRASSARSPSDYDTAIAVCEGIVKTAQVVLADYRRRRNALLRINAIPTEILAQILYRSISDVVEPEWVYYDELRKLRLVSTRWADIIDGLKTFWSSAYCHDSAQEVDMTIEKSRGGPLDVGFLCRDVVAVVGWHQHNHETFYNATIADAARWRSLKIRTGTMGDMERVLTAHLPSLESLDVSFRYDEALTEPLLDNWAPALKHVILRRCSVPWDSQALCRLKSISLQKLNHDPPSVDILMAIMGSPFLEEFDIVDCRIEPNIISSSGPTGGLIVLPSLTSMSLIRLSYSAIVTLHPLLNRYVAPKLATFAIDIERFASNFSPHDALLTPVGRWIAGMQGHASRLPLKLDISHSELQVTSGNDEILVSLACEGLLDARWLTVVEQLDENVRAAVKTLKIKLLRQEEPEVRLIISILAQAFPSTTSITVDCLHLASVIDLLGRRDVAPFWYFPRLAHFTTRAHNLPHDPALRLLRERRQRSQEAENSDAPVPLELLRLEGGRISSEALAEIAASGISFSHSLYQQKQ